MDEHAPQSVTSFDDNRVLLGIRHGAPSARLRRVRADVLEPWRHICRCGSRGVVRRLFEHPVPPKLSVPPLDRLRESFYCRQVREGVVVSYRCLGLSHAVAWVRALVRLAGQNERSGTGKQTEHITRLEIALAALTAC
jgi:hypothetical protein